MPAYNNEHLKHAQQRKNQDLFRQDSGRGTGLFFIGNSQQIPSCGISDPDVTFAPAHTGETQARVATAAPIDQ